MQVRVSVVVPAVIAAWGYASHHPYAWVPATSALASIVDFSMRPWWMGESVGEWPAVSIAIRFMVGLIANYGTLTFWVSVGLAVYWLFA